MDLWTTQSVAHRVHSRNNNSRPEHRGNCVTHVAGQKCHPCPRLHIPRPPGAPATGWRATVQAAPPFASARLRRTARATLHGELPCRAGPRGQSPLRSIGPSATGRQAVIHQGRRNNMARPNLLILMVDQLAGTLFPDGPAPFLHAPNLRALAERSRCFANAYTASPLCAPARASFMTGRLPRRTGVYDNAAELRLRHPDLRPLPAAGRLPHRASPARCTSSAPTSCTASRSG